MALPVKIVRLRVAVTLSFWAAAQPFPPVEEYSRSDSEWP